MNAVVKSIDFADLQDPDIKRSIAAAQPVASLWPDPDMTVLCSGRRKAPVMPCDLFGAVWPLIEEVAEGTASPVDYAAMGFLSCAASLIGGKRWVSPFPNQSTWREPSVIWAAIVGSPSSNKSPPLLALCNILKTLEEEETDNHKEAIRLHRTESERAKVEYASWQDAVKAAAKDGVATPSLPDAAIEPNEPQRKRLMVKDITPEQLLEILSGNPQGVLAYRDELMGWFLSMDRYSPGGRQQWLEAFSGQSFTSDRKGNGGTYTFAPFNGVSVLGGIQPDKLSTEILKGDDDGLAARFLWAWPEAVPFSRPKRLANVGKVAAIFRRLATLDWGVNGEARQVAIVLPLDGPASDLFERWARQNGESEEEGGPLFTGFVGKLRGYVLRLALVSELANWAAGDGAEPKSVSLRTLAAAIDWAEEYGKPSALRVFGDAALSPVERHAAIIGRYIMKHKLKTGNEREWRRKSGLPLPKDTRAWGDAFEWIKDAGWIRETPHREGGTIGRSRSDFDVNPKLWGGA